MSIPLSKTGIWPMVSSSLLYRIMKFHNGAFTDYPLCIELCVQPAEFAGCPEFRHGLPESWPSALSTICYHFPYLDNTCESILQSQNIFKMQITVHIKSTLRSPSAFTQVCKAQLYQHQCTKRGLESLPSDSFLIRILCHTACSPAFCCLCAETSLHFCSSRRSV